MDPRRTGLTLALALGLAACEGDMVRDAGEAQGDGDSPGMPIDDGGPPRTDVAFDLAVESGDAGDGGSDAAEGDGSTDGATGDGGATDGGPADGDAADGGQTDAR